MSRLAPGTLMLALGMWTGLAGAAEDTPAYRVVADGIPESLAAGTGDADRGRKLIVARESANCVLCHAIPDPAVRIHGDVGPSLAGIGARLTAPQLRLRISDSLRLNPATVMPSYYKVEGLDRVAAQYAGKPVLTAQEVEDIVAYLASVRCARVEMPNAGQCPRSQRAPACGDDCCRRRAVSP